MFLHPVDLTTALRPSLLPDETLLFVQDTIGLYEGKFKIPNLQDGHAYLTSHRVCYVDNTEPRKNSVAAELKNIDRYEFYAGFLKSSAKVTLYPKAAKRASAYNRQTSIPNSPLTAPPPSRSSTASPINRGTSSYSTISNSSTATWVCTICSYSNPVPSNFAPTSATSNTPIPPCLSCGIKPSFPHVLKAAIASATGRQAPSVPNHALAQPLLESHHQFNNGTTDEYADSDSSAPLPASSRFQCPRCTFLNHPSLLSCEMCGGPLLSSDSKAHRVLGGEPSRPESPGPILNSEALDPSTNEPPCIKLSFRGGGEKIFHERLKNAMVQRKWLLQNAPPIPEPLQNGTIDPQSSTPHPPTRAKSAGIAGLERRGLELRQKNEAVIGSAFEDLDALMASAKEIITLAESFAKNSSTSDNGSESASQLIAESAKALDMVTTKDMLSAKSDSPLYLSELSRNLAEHLTDDSKGVLKKEGGIMSLVDLWAVFNRARTGVELVSPAEFEKAARLWDKLKLPVRLRTFRNGLLVVQQADRTDENTIAQLESWLADLHSLDPNPSLLLHPRTEEVGYDIARFGRGVTAQEAAMKFGWSVGVASEELEMAEERGAVVREEGVEGTRFWRNWIGVLAGEEADEWGIGGGGERGGVDDVVRNLRDTGLL